MHAASSWPRDSLPLVLIYLYLSISISIYLSIYIYLSLSIYLYLSISIYIYLSISIYLYLSISIYHLSIYLSLSIYLRYQPLIVSTCIHIHTIQNPLSHKNDNNRCLLEKVIILEPQGFSQSLHITDLVLHG